MLLCYCNRAGEEVVGQLVCCYQKACREFLAAFWEMSSFVLCLFDERCWGLLIYHHLELWRSFCQIRFVIFYSSLVMSVIRLILDLMTCCFFLVCLSFFCGQSIRHTAATPVLLWACLTVSVSAHLKCLYSFCHHSGLGWTSEVSRLCLWRVVCCCCCSVLVPARKLTSWRQLRRRGGLARLLFGRRPEWAHPWQRVQLLCRRSAVLFSTSAPGPWTK